MWVQNSTKLLKVFAQLCVIHPEIPNSDAQVRKATENGQQDLQLRAERGGQSTNKNSAASLLQAESPTVRHCKADPFRHVGKART